MTRAALGCVVAITRWAQGEYVFANESGVVLSVNARFEPSEPLYSEYILVTNDTLKPSIGFANQHGGLIFTSEGRPAEA